MYIYIHSIYTKPITRFYKIINRLISSNAMSATVLPIELTKTFDGKNSTTRLLTFQLDQSRKVENLGIYGLWELSVSPSNFYCMGIFSLSSSFQFVSGDTMVKDDISYNFLNGEITGLGDELAVNFHFVDYGTQTKTIFAASELDFSIPESFQNTKAGLVTLLKLFHDTSKNCMDGFPPSIRSDEAVAQVLTFN